MIVANYFVRGAVRSPRMRWLYRTCRATPLVGAAMCACAKAVLPSRNPAWTQLSAGSGEGLWFYCDPVYEEPYAKGDHELETQDQLKARLKPGDCLYDLGAHTGFLSVIAGRLVGEKGLVLAVEADPENATVLRANAERNQMAQIQVLEAAAWSHSGQLTFSRPRPFTRMEGHVVEAPDDQSIAVPAVSLDDLIFKEGRRPPQLVKIDVEGAEWAVLEGARRMLREVKPALLCDVHNAHEVEKICALLREFGYSTEERLSSRSRYIDERVPQVSATSML